MSYDIVSLYYFIDEFCKVYEEWERHKLLPSVRQRKRECRLRLSEMLTIMVIFHLSPCKNFKWFYQAYLPYRHGHDFPGLVCYDRFVALMPRLFLPLHLLLHTLMGEQTGIYFMDATHLPVCHNRRIQRNRVFNGMAERGKSSMGWFYGFKLHIVINHKGQLMAAKITRGNVDDRAPADAMTAHLKGLLCADKGYISAKLFKSLYERGLKLIAGIRKGMKNHLMPIYEKILRRKRFLVETVFDILKTETNINHTRHRSPANAAVNILAALVAYSFKTNKPKLKAMTLIHS
jgi:hypothetical protein